MKSLKIVKLRERNDLVFLVHYKNFPTFEITTYKMQKSKENIKSLFLGMSKQTTALLSKIVFAQYSF